MPKNYKLIFIILMLVPIGQVAIDIYVPSLPAITNFFNTSKSLAQLTVSFYLIGFSIGQIIYGSISDALGRKNPLLIGIIIFLCGTVLAIFAPSIAILLIARFIQGIGISAASVLFKSITSESFTGEPLAKISNYIVIIWGLGPIIAPVIGGYIQHYLGWKYNFVFLLLYGFWLLYLVYYPFEETIKNKIPLAVKSLAKNNFAVLTHREFIATFIAMAAVYSVIVSFNVYAPFLIQTVLGYSAISYGHFALIIGFFFFAGAMTNRLLIKKILQTTLIKIAIVLMIIATIVMLIIALAGFLNIITVVLPSAIIIYFCGILYPNINAKFFSLFPHMAGTASSVLGFCFMLLSSFVTILVSLLETKNAIPLAYVYVALALSCAMAMAYLYKSSSSQH